VGKEMGSYPSLAAMLGGHKGSLKKLVCKEEEEKS